MSWLVRMEIDARLAYEKRIIDSYAWHRALWECFPGEPDKKRDFLTRVDGRQGYFTAWILTPEKPTRPAWCGQEHFAVKEVAPGFLSHRLYAFDLRANPTRALVQRDGSGAPLCRPNGKRKSGKRVPLIKEDELRSWIERKALAGGFRIDDSCPLEIGLMEESYFSQKWNRAYHGGVQFRGRLEVIDRTLFERTYYSGIGGAKGFGFGLLLLAPVSPQYTNP